MSKRAYFVSIGCFVIGLALGVGGTYFFAMAHWGKTTADGLFLIKELEVADSGTRAFEAYQRESRPVAIYALSQHLVTLQKAHEIGSESPVFMTRLEILRGMMFTHARLAKLYTEAGQTDLSAKHVAEALRFAGETGKFPAVTNQPALTEIVAMFDQKGIQ